MKHKFRTVTDLAQLLAIVKYPKCHFCGEDITNPEAMVTPFRDGKIVKVHALCLFHEQESTVISDQA